MGVLRGSNNSVLGRCPPQKSKMPNAEQRSAYTKPLDVAGTADWDTRNASLGLSRLSQNKTGGINSGRSHGAKRLHAAWTARCYLKLLGCVLFGGGEAMSRGMKRVCRVGVVAGPGPTHACGHDVHMAVFVGVARLLAQTKDQWSGTLVMSGQPAEEASRSPQSACFGWGRSIRSN